MVRAKIRKGSMQQPPPSWDRALIMLSCRHVSKSRPKQQSIKRRASQNKGKKMKSQLDVGSVRNRKWPLYYSVGGNTTGLKRTTVFLAWRAKSKWRRSDVFQHAGSPNKFIFSDEWEFAWLSRKGPAAKEIGNCFWGYEQRWMRNNVGKTYGHHMEQNTSLEQYLLYLSIQ